MRPLQERSEVQVTGTCSRIYLYCNDECFIVDRTRDLSYVRVYTVVIITSADVCLGCQVYERVLVNPVEIFSTSCF